MKQIKYKQLSPHYIAQKRQASCPTKGFVVILQRDGLPTTRASFLETSISRFSIWIFASRLRHCICKRCYWQRSWGEAPSLKCAPRWYAPMEIHTSEDVFRITHLLQILTLHENALDPELKISGLMAESVHLYRWAQYAWSPLPIPRSLSVRQLHPQPKLTFFMVSLQS